MSASHLPHGVSRWTVTILFLIGMSVFLGLAYRSEINDNRIGDNTRRLQNLIESQCEDRNTAARDTNKVLDQLIAVNRTVKTLPAAEIRDRIALYTSVKVPVANCATP